MLAHDALVPIVSTRTDVAQISLDDLVAAYRGIARNWSDIGGPDLPLEPHLDRSDHAAWFETGLLADPGVAEDVVRHRGPAELSQTVAVSQGALGLVSFRDWGDTRPLPVAGHCGIRLSADANSLRTLDYPLTVPLVLLLPDRRRPPLADEFLRWLQTDRAKAVVRRVGFVDQGIEPIPIDVQGGRLAEAIAQAGQEVTLPELQAMIAAFDGRVRLSPTFRFEGDGLTLDLPSHAWVEELAEQVSSGRYDGRTLLLAGFSDGQGPSDANRAMSGAGAEEVMAALVGALGGRLPDGVRLRIRAFGEALPMGCDDTEWGRRLNRRVELWVEE